MEVIFKLHFEGHIGSMNKSKKDNFWTRKEHGSVIQHEARMTTDYRLQIKSCLSYFACGDSTVWVPTYSYLEYGIRILHSDTCHLDNTKCLQVLSPVLQYHYYMTFIRNSRAETTMTFCLRNISSWCRSPQATWLLHWD